MQIEEKVTGMPLVDSWRTTNSLCEFFVTVVIVIVVVVAVLVLTF